MPLFLLHGRAASPGSTVLTLSTDNMNTLSTDNMDSRLYLAEIIPGLYLGNLRSLYFLDQLQITHVLSVVSFPIHHDLSKLTSKQIKIQDLEDTNILEHLPTALNFIHMALTGKQMTAPADLMSPTEDADEASNGDANALGAPSNALDMPLSIPAATSPDGNGRQARVLVHCQAGMSRSASVVIAYIMKTKSLDFEEALSFVRSKWSSADPNEGFRAQLEVFHEMKYSLNLDHAVYRLHQFGKQHEEEGYVDPDSFAVLPEDLEASKSKVPLYRCRKCRKLLATARNVLSQAEVAAGHKVFLARKRTRHQPPGETDKQQSAAGIEGSSLFLEPMQWMSTAVVGQVQGKLYCPGCSARLGSFDWSGITNEHGQWVTPAFQIHVNKVDVVTSSSSAVLASGSGPMGARISMPQHVRQQPAAATVGPQPAQAQPTDATAVNGDAHESNGVLTVAAEPSETVAVEQSKPAAEQVQQSRQLTSGAAWFTHMVLDCDGVMVDSERASCESLRRSILKVTDFDIPHEFPQDYYEVFGMDVRSCVEHYKAKFNRQDWVDTEVLAQKVQAVKEGIYMELTQELGIKAFPGARPLIAEARALGLPVGIASSGAPAKIAHNLGSSGLLGLVEEPFIVSAAYVQRGKPAPDVYVEALKRLGCTEPGRALVVEDAVNGLKAARAAGAFCVAVTTSLPRETLAPYADLVVDDLLQLVGMLRTLQPGAVQQVVSA